MDIQNNAGDAAQTSELETKKDYNFIKRTNPKILITIVVLVVLAALAYGFKSLFVAATVDGHIISRLSVIKKLEKQSGKTALDSLIDDQLVNNEASKKNITASDDEVNQKLDVIKSQIEAQGGSFDEALTGAGLTLNDLKKQLITQVKLEKLLSDKITVSDDEVTKYIADNKVTLEAGKEDATKSQIRDQLKSTKLNNEFAGYMSDLRTAAKINTYVKY